MAKPQSKSTTMIIFFFFIPAFWWITGELGAHLIKIELNPITSSIIFAFWWIIYLYIAIDHIKLWQKSRQLSGVSEDDQASLDVSSMARFFGLVGLLCLPAALACWGWQIFYWLRTANWISLDFRSLLLVTDESSVGPRSVLGDWQAGKFEEWLADPNTWTGVHIIAEFLLSWVTLPLTLLVIGIGGLIAEQDMLQERDKVIASRSTSLES